MGAVPRHPFFLRVIDELPKYNRNWLLPYITIMASTGPLFLSIMWRHYNVDGPADNARIRILFPDEYNDYPWSFFTHHRGNSWHGSDVKLIFWVCHLHLLRSGSSKANKALDGSTLGVTSRRWFRYCRGGVSNSLVALWQNYAFSFVQRPTQETFAPLEKGKSRGL